MLLIHSNDLSMKVLRSLLACSHDDQLITSHSPVEHLEHLCSVSERIVAHQIPSVSPKVSFAYQILTSLATVLTLFEFLQIWIVRFGMPLL